MRIGELAQRTGASRRLLRYYEEQGLIVPDRSDNGYRDYDPRYVDRVRQIRGLLGAGLTTRIIKQILPCLGQAALDPLPRRNPGMLRAVARRARQADRAYRCPHLNRDAIDRNNLIEVERCKAPEGPERSDDRAREGQIA